MLTNHLEYADKYWYYAQDASVLNSIKHQILIDSDSKRNFLYCVNRLIEKYANGPITFRVIGNKCYYCNYMSCSNFEDSYFEIPFNKYKKTKTNQRFYGIIDSVRKYIRVKKLVSMSSIIGIGMIVSLVLNIVIICGVLFGLVIVIYAIIIFIEALYETMLYLGIEIDLLKKFFQSLGEYIIPPSSFGIVGHYIEALFMFVIGCSLIRGAIDAFKDN